MSVLGLLDILMYYDFEEAVSGQQSVIGKMVPKKPGETNEEYRKRLQAWAHSELRLDDKRYMGETPQEHKERMNKRKS